ncbi:hypothetical protein, partial [Chryseotalea sanaruensis]|uniref:hypothetical protein n=1 Tax=Chryseotalea sanaruensis TaxID=2482724 RepID=UPI00135B5D15
PTLRSVRLPGAHMPTLAIKTKLQRTCLPYFILRPQRLGATPPLGAFVVKAQCKKSDASTRRKI